MFVVAGELVYVCVCDIKGMKLSILTLTFMVIPDNDSIDPDHMPVCRSARRIRPFKCFI